jgi:hypothetical protein
MRAHPLRFAPLIFLITACATTQSALVNMWVDTGHEAEPTKNVMVVALWQDHEARALWEERFVQELEQHHSQATPSYTELVAALPDSAAVIREARSRKCDAVIVIHEHVEDRNTFYIPGVTMPRQQKIPRWYRYHGGTEIWVGDNAAGYSTLSCDVEMWVPQDRAGMVWSGTTELFDPGSDDYAAYKVADTVIAELARLGLVPARL